MALASIMPIFSETPQGWTPEVQAAFDRALAANNGQATILAQRLFDENFHLREDKRKLNDDLKAVKDKLPEGAVVLSKEDAAAFEAYKALGKPEDVKKSLDEKTKNDGELADLKFKQLIGDAAQAHGFKPNVLADIVKAKGMSIEIGETEVDDGKGGKVKKPAAFVLTNEGKSKVNLSDYARDNLSDYLPSLAAQAGQGAGQQWVSQGQGAGGAGNGQGAGGSVLDKFLTDRDKRAAETPNPLKPTNVVNNAGVVNQQAQGV